MLSPFQNPHLIPGYYSYVLGEETQDIAEEKLDSNNSHLRHLCEHVMYSIVEDPSQYYRLGLNRFISACHEQLEDEELPNINPTLIYFYNRQLIVQMTSHPKVLPSNDIHIPLDREPNDEIQVDILALNESQTIANFNMPYLVVILEPFSRFLWTYPTARLLSSYVRKAFYLALSRPGIGHDFYLHIRDKVTRLVVDGGSEFKDSFEENFTQAFPNASLLRSFAKSKTRGRPTNTGPVEAAIGTLRRVLRDHEIGIHPSFLKSNQTGLTKLLDAYNNMSQTKTLDSVSPQEAVESILGKNTPGLIPHLKAYMDQHQQQQITRKKEVMRDTGIDKSKQVLATDRHGPVAYRLYLPPPPFVKLVTLRVSLDAYVIETYHGGQNHPYVDLISYGNGTKRLRNIHMKQLVLVKAPINDGPEIIRHNLQLDIETLRVRHTPRDVSLAFEITPEIRHAVGNGAPELENQALDNNPIVREAQRNGGRGVLPRRFQDYDVPEPGRRGNGAPEPREPRGQRRGR
jgi:hypothetical protein